MLKKLWTLASVNWKLTVSFGFAVIWGVAAAGLLVAWKDGIAVLGAMVGFALGWFAGILMAPYQEEEKRFTRVSKGVAGFIGGYIVGKVDRVFDLVVDKANGGPLILNPYFARTIWLAAGCFFVTGLTVFVARTYWQELE
jgi:hypothetical protein